MLRRVLFSFLVVLSASPALFAQEAPKDDEMAFIQRLRDRGYADLALNYLETRISKNPKYAADAPIEIALTRAALARAEPDAAKRLALFAQARADLDAFLAKNAMHPRAAAVQIETARIAADQGRIQLSRALALTEGDPTRGPELQRAIHLLNEAAKVIEDVAKQLKNPRDLNENEFERGVLRVSQGHAFLALARIDAKQQTKLEDESRKALKEAIELLDGLVDKMQGADPLRARALAWVGRALSLDARQNDEVRRKFEQANSALEQFNDPLARRQIIYFRMLHLFENEKGVQPADALVLREAGTTWFNANPGFRNTYEGRGIQFILAKIHFDAGRAAPEGSAPRTNNWNVARAYIRNIEATENEFNAQAQELKIAILFEQKAFQRDIATLNTFDDLYMRALYEHQQLNKDRKEGEPNPFDTREKKAAQQKRIIATLNRSLKAAIEQDKPPRKIPVPPDDLSTAYYLLTGYYLNVEPWYRVSDSSLAALSKGKAPEGLVSQLKRLKDRDFDTKEAFEAELNKVVGKAELEPQLNLVLKTSSVDNVAEAAHIGEEFIRKHPQSRHANTIALFTARALSDVIKKGAGDDYDQMTEERERLFNLGRYMADRWPGDKAGDYGRYLLVVHLIKKPLTAVDDAGQVAERKKREEEAIKIGRDVARFHIGVERAKKQKFIDTILLLSDIKRDYGGYTLVQYQLGLAALQLDKDDTERKKLNKPSALAEENERRVKNGEPPLVLGVDDAERAKLKESKTPFKDLAILAFKRVPDDADLSDPETALFYFRAKSQLGFLLYATKGYDEMEKLANRLLPLVASAKSLGEQEQKTFQMQLGSILLYGVYGKSDDLYREGKYLEAVTAIDPLVNQLREGKHAELAENQQLMSAILGMALRGNMLIDRGPRAREVFAVWNAIEKNRIKVKTEAEAAKLKAGVNELDKKQGKSAEEQALLDQQKKQLESVEAQLTEEGLNLALAAHRANVLQQTFAVVKKQIDELRRKNEKEKHDKIVNAFTILLNEEKGDETKLTPDMRLLLGQCYVALGRMSDAIPLLTKYPAPKPNDEAAKQSKYKVVQVLLIRAYRLQGRDKDPKDEKRYDEVKKRIEEIMKATPEDIMKKQPGWGKRDLNALKEEVLFYADLKAWGAVVNRCNTLLATLGKQMAQGGANAAIRDHYFEISYYYIVGFIHSALEQKDEMKKENYLQRAAKFYKSLITNHPTLGGEDNKERFDSFLKTDEGKVLQAAVNKLP